MVSDFAHVGFTAEIPHLQPGLSGPISRRGLPGSTNEQFQVLPRPFVYLVRLTNHCRLGASLARNLAGNPDSPQAVIFLASITDVMMGS